MVGPGFPSLSFTRVLRFRVGDLGPPFTGQVRLIMYFKDTLTLSSRHRLFNVVEPNWKPSGCLFLS